MTDVEMVKRCAGAMGYMADVDWVEPKYDPLHNDAQAMALVKKFRLDIERCDDGEFMVTWGEKLGNFVKSPDLNRAIVECVANMGEQI